MKRNQHTYEMSWLLLFLYVTYFFLAKLNNNISALFSRVITHSPPLHLSTSFSTLSAHRHPNIRIPFIHMRDVEFSGEWEKERKYMFFFSFPSLLISHYDIVDINKLSSSLMIQFIVGPLNVSYTTNNDEKNEGSNFFFRFAMKL